MNPSIIKFLSLGLVASVMMAPAVQAMKINNREISEERPEIRVLNKQTKTNKAVSITSNKDRNIKVEWLNIGVQDILSKEFHAPVASTKKKPKSTGALFQLQLDEDEEDQSSEEEGLSCYPTLLVLQNTLEDPSPYDVKRQKKVFDSKSLHFSEQFITNVNPEEPLVFSFMKEFPICEMSVFPENGHMNVLLHGYLAVINGRPKFDLLIFNAKNVRFIMRKDDDIIPEPEETIEKNSQHVKAIPIAKKVRGESRSFASNEEEGVGSEIPFRNTYVPPQLRGFSLMERILAQSDGGEVPKDEGREHPESLETLSRIQSNIDDDSE